ncbi:ChaN family lipoprotein [Marinobacter persicus]|uniref:Iron-regulated protein n=1 Tax=Marinobacter persicus TaxID=930118 RepID=A0A2S6GAS8_9GAMM|nr:ChaN family lipoprotein [Marinobacter persicus]PPK53676.1 putative iron-regulated protein [Marinobacter persicus]PPK56490.1 putative iron-regulated protein [Marinobacter persicus]PPK60063.1 putative iron-regulated protein [Marinobacter persicus]
MRLYFAALALFTLTLPGCAAMPSDTAMLTPPESQYDARLVDPQTGQLLSVPELASRLSETDVVVIGEFHGHHGSHLLQARLQQALFQHNPAQILSMEQFNLDHQQVLDDYLEGRLGETEMLEDAQAWDNYRASYRPVVEFARQHHLPVMAANAPADVVRCVGRQGPAYLDTLAPAQRDQLPDSPFLDTPAYKEKFVEAIQGSHGTDNESLSERMRNTYRAQLLRDNTMAERILHAREEHPNHQVIHLTGTFHSEERLGTVAVLEKRAPKLSVALISPVIWANDTEQMPLEDNRNRGDYLYFIQPLPEEYKDEDRRRKAMQARFSRSKPADCD